MSLEHFDVLVVGAGLSGIGAGYHLQDACPGKTYAILEGRDAIGGTWDLFRYPGIRSDSDMFTLGYGFRPWTEAKAIADGPSILNYVRETADVYGIEKHIRFGHKVTGASWSTADARWTVQAQTPDGPAQLTCSFLYLCSGYYRYDAGYTPEFPGAGDFKGDIVHPQHWPQDLDYAGKRVVIIGSGATAVTLVPAMAKTAAHVTMLQRSPSYVVSLPAKDPIADVLRRRLPEKAAHRIIRWKNVLTTMAFFELSRRRPELVKKVLRKGVIRKLPRDIDVDVHFKPAYNPWDQRLCLVPDDDLFRALRSKQASIVTDHIDTFTETGIRLHSGEHLDADVIVTATGLQMVAMGGLDFIVDDEAVDIPSAISYKGVMLSGVPNMAACFGYTNASWTLRADLISRFVCRQINYMDDHGYRQCTPRADPGMATGPILDFSSGYIQRAMALFPKQGTSEPWQVRQNYIIDRRTLERGAIEDGAMTFSA